MKKLTIIILLSLFSIISAEAQNLQINARVQNVSAIYPNNNVIKQCNSAVSQGGNNWQSYLNSKSLVGGLLGGTVGRQFGGGKGNDIMTVLGAIGGAYLANNINNSGANNFDNCVSSQNNGNVITPMYYQVDVLINGQTVRVLRNQKPQTQVIPIIINAI